MLWPSRPCHHRRCRAADAVRGGADERHGGSGEYGGEREGEAAAFSTGQDAVAEDRTAELRRQTEKIADELSSHGCFSYDNPTVWDGDGKLHVVMAS
ncbi:hypothetical protein [Streptomyces sp. NPDC001274]